MLYRKQILRTISRLENRESLENVGDLRVAIAELSKVWQCDVSQSTIFSFRKAGFLSIVIEEELIRLQVTVRQIEEKTS